MGRAERNPSSVRANELMGFAPLYPSYFFDDLRRPIMPVVRADIEPLTIVFEDDGLVPNNPMPFLVYKRAGDAANDHLGATIEGLSGANGWGAMWRNGVYDYAHYHATVHEVLGVARGHSRVQFGGDHGQTHDIAAGDVAI